ncbi:hypothetical protein [Protofrankia symbiont of Coriaria ruscifolia]|uniref:Putative membrane protein n=1 Tax=Candidatus Protofrankia californiensis TaxID=1839754 RepID=A0A1C3PE43_9ACTN|nr:hypothetical protein [Protofrankia symbiont of Coriaria ruscifolia]SBW28105.1 putative membrane protein [Candidatus Protofrankia californiensis]
MVALRSRREDRTLLVAAWVLAVTVLVLGVAVVAPILIMWGVLGVAAAVFATRIHLRDTRARRLEGQGRHDHGSSAPPEAQVPGSLGASDQAQAAPAAHAEEPADPDSGSPSVQADAVEQEHVR